ncbi:MAG TPA: CHAD domain-containing protein [Fimbriimonadaceae bacterium]|jgi:CHAD domain-containing protein
MGTGATRVKPEIEKTTPLMTATTSAGEAAFLILDRDFQIFLIKEKLVLESDDPEAVHDMRVAARRMRSAIQTFESFLPAAIVKSESELQWIFKRLGVVRDLDIDKEKLLAWHETTPGKEEAFQELADKLTEERKKARGELKRSIHSQRYKQLVQELSASLSKGPSSHNALASVPVIVVAPDLIEKRYKRARKIGKALTESSPSPEFHRLRKQAKKLRYTLDFFAELYGKSGEQMVSHLKGLQDLLGSRQDDVMASDHLKAIVATNGLAKGTKTVAKKIISSFSDEAKQYAHDFEPAFEDVFGKPWRKLDRVMKKSRTQLWAD